MAINSFEKSCAKFDSKYSSNNRRGNILSSAYLLKLGLAADENTSSSDAVSTRKTKNAKSPYLIGDSVQLLSKVTEKKMIHKRGTNVMSSFPLAINLYKANSDEFKAQKKVMKKAKKSVLTLPNVQATIPQTCTVSDMNDSEYFNNSDDNKKLKAKKRLLAQNKKSKARNKDYQFYDRDARYCSQLDINLDCSSTDVINQYNGDEKGVSKPFYSKNKTNVEREFSAHDMWTVLRNINRFQFRPSPPISNDSIHSHKKRKSRNKRKNFRNKR
jgi:hypothetical protein